MSNKIVLITGSSSGIGRAAAVEFARNGYDVAINYSKNKDGADALKQELQEKYHVNATTWQADVSDEEDVKKMVAGVVETYGKIDCLVSNAGIVYDRPFADITVEEFKKTLAVDVMGAFIVARCVVEYMPKQPSSSIVIVSSTNGTKTVSPDCLDYNIAKIGLQSLTRDLAFQLKPDIRVNAVAPGWVDTRMNADLDPAYIQEETEKVYLGRFAQPEEIANLIYFLASDKASYINGEVINIDGGY